VAVKPISEGLFTWPEEEPTLIGGRCPDCAAITFPLRTGCPRCGRADPERHLLSRSGTLWSWTSQGFMPKAPFNGQFVSEKDFEPWFVGVVELPGELRLESILTGVTQDTLRIGMPLRLVTIPFRTDDQGNEVVTFAFAPGKEAIGA
jgi:uncharacterized protein